ncbi:DUF2059 domain-containing protein [Jiella marina]|uniref:hypothetical protein n=1 Tax=Jiella sp. LLJ827 TaxID=2917712 RepID=UPI002101D0B5|nr:hypothetical protein [Jiella sp. LLJ827]MCQ0986473.1 hypothetical protein [Jiella sp. LLJ827]
MPRLLTASAVALVLFGSSLASAQNVPGSEASIRASDSAERQKVAAGYRDAAASSSSPRNTTYGYGFPTASQRSFGIPGSDASRKRAEEAARASVLKPRGAGGF